MSQFAIQALLHISEVASNAVQLSAQVVQLQQNIQFLALELASYSQGSANGDIEIAQLKQTIDQMRAAYHAELRQSMEEMRSAYRSEATAFLEQEINKQQVFEAKVNDLERQIAESLSREQSLEEKVDASTRQIPEGKQREHSLRLQLQAANQRLKASTNHRDASLDELGLLRRQNCCLNEELDEVKAKLRDNANNDIETALQLDPRLSKQAQRRKRWDSDLKKPWTTKPEFKKSKLTSMVTEAFYKSKRAGNVIKDRKKVNKTRQSKAKQSKAKSRYISSKLEDMLGDMSLFHDADAEEAKSDDSDDSDDKEEGEL